jgi:hypothetical protein
MPTLIKKSSKFNCKCHRARKMSFAGNDVLVVPVVMLKTDVPMNKALTPEDEVFPPAWNGIPVTLGHPQNGRMTANTPEMYEKYKVGNLFNTKLDGNKLKGELYIETKAVEKLSPQLHALLNTDTPIQVSTGFFCYDEPSTGEINGREYEFITRNVKPDHLAILLNEEGACNWDDGCGIRPNLRTGKTKMTKKAVKRRNEGDEDKKDEPTVEQMVAALMTAEDTPFDEKDKDALMQMGGKALTRLMDQYAKKAQEEVPPEKDDEEKKDEPVTAASIQSLVTKAIANALKSADIIPAETRTVLELLKTQATEHKAALVSRVVANSTVKKADAEKMDVHTLQLFANNLPTANFGGRVVARDNAGNGESDDPAIKAMTGTNSLKVYQDMRKKK